MKRKQIVVLTTIVLLISLLVVLMPKLKTNTIKQSVKNTETTQKPSAFASQTAPLPKKQVVGSDKDSHGCIGSAGYTWCEPKQKCLRTFEEQCLSDSEKTIMETQIKQQLSTKLKLNPNDVAITTLKITGDYSKGEINSQGGGGIWFAAKVNGSWKLVWDGNGIILCSDIKNYPNFPAALMPACYDDSAGQLVERK